MIKNPVLSVIIPAYNEEDYIESCLKSIMHQDFDNPYEILVIDNNSTDKTASIAKKIHARVVKERKKGYAHAMNTGVKHARAPIIVVTDADCIVPHSWLTQIFEAFNNSDVVGVGGPFTFYDASKITKTILDIVNSVAPKLFIITLVGMNMAYKKSVCIKTGGYDPKANPQADTQLGLTLQRQGRLVFLKHNVVQSSARRFQRPHVALYEYLTRLINVLSLKLSGKTLFRKMKDYR